MRVSLVALVLLLGMAYLQATAYQIVRVKNGRTVNIENLSKELQKYDVIFFGEFHDDQIIHSLQAELLPLLYQRNTRLIVSFEMFERDVQTYMNSYIQGEMTEADFLLNSRPWENYQTDYKALLDFAKAKKLHTVAANVPRYLAGRAVRSSTDFMASLTEREREYVATEINADNDKYKELFIETMKQAGAHGMPGDIAMYHKLYYAQCLKDDTMAESIVRALISNPKHKLIHFNGDFHSKYFLGTVQRVRMRNPKLKLAVLSPLYVESLPDKKSLKNLPELSGLKDTSLSPADYLILLPNRPQDPKE